MLALKIGTNYYTIGQGSTLQKISEADIIARGGDIQKQIQSGDIQVVDPSQLKLAPASKYEGGVNPTGYYLEVNGQPLNLGGSALRITNQAEAQALGVNATGANLAQGGTVATDTEAQRINQPTSKTFGGTISADMTGTSSSQPSQIYRDNQNNFFAVDAQGNRTPLNLDQFHALGLNETFVKPGQTVSLSQAQTGQVGAPGSSGATGGTAGGAGGPSPDDIASKLRSLGLTDAQIQQMSPQDQANWAAIGATIQSKIDQGNPMPQLLTADDLQRFLTEAQNDPNIDAYYKNQLKVGTQDLVNNFNYLQQGTQFQQQQIQQQQEQDRKNLAEQFASQGAAYSGFRQQAAQQLGTTQSGIVKSSLSEAEKNLQSLLGQYESTYGTSALTSSGIPLSLTGALGQASYSPYGNQPGTLEQQRLQDIRNLQQQKIQQAELARGITQ